MDLNFEEAIDFIQGGYRFLLTTHVNSDADGIGACMAMQQILEQLGKEAHIGLPEAPAEQCAFLDGWDAVQHIDALTQKAYTHAIILDCPNLERVGSAADRIADLPTLTLDHHKGNPTVGQTRVVTTHVSSTCELVYHLAQAADWPLNTSIAAALYTGIIFDTGGFRFSLTTPETFEVAAQLVRHDIRLDLLADQLFNNRSYASVKQLGTAIDSLTLHCDERVAVLHLNAEAMRAGDPDGAVNYGLMVKGVEVAVILKEYEEGKYRVSLRSQEGIDVNAVANAFAGGGHVRAAGCRMEGRAEEVTHRLLTQIKHRLP